MMFHPNERLPIDVMNGPGLGLALAAVLRRVGSEAWLRLHMDIIILIHSCIHQWANTLRGYLAEQTLLKNLFTCVKGRRCKPQRSIQLKASHTDDEDPAPGNGFKALLFIRKSQKRTNNEFKT